MTSMLFHVLSRMCSCVCSITCNILCSFGVILFQNGERYYDIFKLNKENFDLSREDNLFAGMESSMNYTCNQIDELPSYSWSFRKFWNDLGLFK